MTAQFNRHLGWGHALAAGAVLAAISGSALAQNSLGDGTGLSRPLDRELGRNVPSRRSNTAATFQQELNLRNAIVTGNSPGGTSFRGDVGYSAPSEFRASLGSNDLFAFRRDSLFSGFAGLGLRGTEALQYQFALATGSASGLLGVGPVSRSGGGVGTQAPSPLADPTFVQGVAQQRAPTTVPTTRVGESEAPAGSMMGMLRTPSAYVANRGIQAEIMAEFFDASTNINWGLTASSLRGVRMSRMSLAQAQLERPGAVPTSATPNLVADPGQPVQASPVEGATRGPTLATPNSYQAMLDRFRDAAAGRLQPAAPTPAPGAPDPVDPNAVPVADPTRLNPTTSGVGTPEWERRLAEIRQRLALDLEDPQRGPASPVNRSNNNAANNAATDPENPENNRAPGMNPGSLTYRPLDAEALRILRESAHNVTTYVDPASPTDPYAQHMAVAGELMRAGSYFDAEERFTRAQAARTDDFLATIGRFHAQVGAGMYLSAGMNLRRLLTDHPEVAATRFDPSMLPDAARLEKVAGELRANASRAIEGQSVSLGTDSALLLAYVGYQRRDAGLVTEGLEAYRRLLSASGSVGTTGQTLLDLITQVWGAAPAETP